MNYDYAVSQIASSNNAGWAVWSLKPMTGDKLDLLETHQTKNQALAHIDRLRRDNAK